MNLNVQGLKHFFAITYQNLRINFNLGNYGSMVFKAVIIEEQTYEGIRKRLQII